MTFATFIAIIEANGFVFERHGGGSHKIYRGVVNGSVQKVVVADIGYMMTFRVEHYPQ